jgi:major membrane immunogen (membrane-anchored lipoprotein)
MNSKSVLSKIMTLLSLENEVNFTDAKDAQGQILQSPTFDVDESVEIVSEDGTKSPAPDGEHEIELTDSEGNKVVIRIETKDGKIVSRENVEEANPADLEKVDEE